MRQLLSLWVGLGVLVGPRAAEAQCTGYAWDNPSPSYPPRVEHGTFFSAAGQVQVGFNVYVPAGAEGARFPVIYFLHGTGGDEGTMVSNVVTWMEDRVARGLVQPAILVFANGAINSAYADSPDALRPVETMILRELLPHIDAHYPSFACREQRAISGFSMGGNGALLYAFKHSELFGSVVAYAGALLDWSTLSAQHPDTAGCMFGDDPEYFDRYSPWHWLEQRAPELQASLRIRLVVGAEDGLLSANRAMTERLDALLIPHQFEEVPGCRHNHGCLWQAAGDRGVAVHEAAFAPCALPTPADAGAPPEPDASAPIADAGSTTPDAATLAGDDAEAKVEPNAAAAPVAPSASPEGCTNLRPGSATANASWPGLLALGLLAVRRRARKGWFGLLSVWLWACGVERFDVQATDQGAADSGVALDATEMDLGWAEDAQVSSDAQGATDVGIDEGPHCADWVVQGDPTSARGATWTFQSTEGGVSYDLSGVLLTPAGAGPFPAVVISHGRGGQANGYSLNIGLVMRQWGMVVIATNYTHARGGGGLPSGVEGQDQGASPENLLRAQQTRRLLACRPEVDLSRVAAHGHSMGAMVTGALVGRYPALFQAASHTAGGVGDGGLVNDGVFTTSAADVATIRAAYQLHHGEDDEVVPVALGARMADLLAAAGVTHEWWPYAGYNHAAISQDPVMLERIRTWYQAHGLLQ
ncbi:MAG: dienelactone hydrolase family protein [Deltaproteobacteria bacterium]|nr:dienelactone hydrolase family protein [Deltaproteobacteria bacterium]